MLQGSSKWLSKYVRQPFWFSDFFVGRGQKKQISGTYGINQLTSVTPHPMITVLDHFLIIVKPMVTEIMRSFRMKCTL